MSWSDEMADVVDECLEEFPGQILAPVGELNVKPYAVCFDYGNPQAGLEAIDAAMQVSGHLSFTMRRAEFVAAGIAEETLIARPRDPSQKYVVNPIEDDEAKPFVRVTARPMP